MPNCPRCGAALRSDVAFCVACGADIGIPAPGPAAAPTLAQAGTPLGKLVAPWKVLLLCVVTLGVYVYVFWWRTAREVDAYAGTRSRGLVAAGIGLVALSLALLMVAFTQSAMPYLAQIAEDPAAQIDQEAVRAAYLANPLYVAAAVASFTGSLAIYAGMWRAWHAIGRDERRRGRADPLQPALFAVFLLAAALLQVASVFVPLLQVLSIPALVATVWVIYAWQSRLNDTWRAASAAPGAW